MKPLPASQLQRAAVRALRLEQNWRQITTRIRHLKRIPHGCMIDQMQLLGPRWLVTLSRSPSKTQVAVWDFGEPHDYHFASVDTDIALKFSAALSPRFGMIIAVIEHDKLRME
jgi:hypothetical protein